MTRRHNDMIDQSIENVFDIKEAPSYLLRMKDQQRIDADAADEQQELEDYKAAEERRLRTKQRMAQHGFSVVEGGKH